MSEKRTIYSASEGSYSDYHVLALTIIGWGPFVIAAVGGALFVAAGFLWWLVTGR